LALAFELVVNFGANHTAADEAREVVLNHAPVKAGTHQLALHPSLLRTVRSYNGHEYLEVSVLPVGVGYNVAIDRGHKHVELTSSELSEVGRGLYELLKQFDAYRAAQVGWDPEAFTDPEEVRAEWAEELAAGDLPGLVLAEDVHQTLNGAGFVPFTPGYVWIPYQGERRSTLTADSPDK
jgi:hypothetical protein